MICENCHDKEADRTATVAGDHPLFGVRIALCDDCASSEEAPPLTPDDPPRLEDVAAARGGDQHMICSTPAGVPCPCIGRPNEWDECCCAAADRRGPRSQCMGCGAPMVATDIETGKPIEEGVSP